MARVTDYASLATTLQAYLGGRTDVGVASGNLDFLLMEAEEEMNTRLRTRRGLTAVTPTVSSSGVVTLPADYGGWKRFVCRNGSSEWDLDLVAAEEKARISSLYASTGVPEALVTLGATSQVWPYTDGLYTFTALYFGRVPQLTSIATTNWVITNYPSAYLYGCLAAAKGFIEDDPRMPTWVKMFNRALDRIVREDAIDLDARTNATLSPDTSMFPGRRTYNVISDSFP